MKNTLIKRIAKSMIGCMFFVLVAMPSFAHATSTDESMHVDVINSNTALVTCEGEMSIVSCEVQGEQLILSIDSMNGSDGYFISDRDNGTIYSSFTGETISVYDLLDEETIDRDNISAVSYGADMIKYISFGKIRALLKKGVDAANTAAVIVEFLWGIGLIVSNPISAIVAIITGIWWYVDQGLAIAGSDHGLRVTLRPKKITKHQPGGATNLIVYNIIGISVY